MGSNSSLASAPGEQQDLTPPEQSQPTQDATKVTAPVPRRQQGGELPQTLEMLEAEQVLVHIAQATYVSVNQDLLVGALRVTNFRLHFEPGNHSGANERRWLFQEPSMFNVPLGCVERVARTTGNMVVSSRARDSLYVHLSCKDFRKLTFRFATVADAARVFDLVRVSAFPISEGQGLKWLFALEHGKACLKSSMQASEGWKLYDVANEMTRQGVFKSPSEVASSRYWRISDLNRAYGFCPSYPAKLVVPSTTSDQDLLAVANFRSKGRIPALTWLSQKSQGSIWRCSQPKVGIGNTCRQDEQLWADIVARSGSSFGRIIDCRPFKNAMANKAKGLGYEDEVRYSNTSISFQNIQNIHVTRTSLEKLLAMICASSYSGGSAGGCAVPGYNWTASIEATGWLNHIRAILGTAVKVAQFAAVNGFPVLVHCSDGWDRTSQICALAQLLADPFFRTIEGFAVLVEKDWLSFGYKFMSRTGHGSDTGTDERSPCFLQFIDCVWQLQSLFPAEFEYNQTFLLLVADELYSCRFGTFLCDNEHERVLQAIPQATLSLWDYVLGNRSKLTNPSYAPSPIAALLPHEAVLGRQVRLWETCYLRFAGAPALPEHAFCHLPSGVRPMDGFDKV